MFKSALLINLGLAISLATPATALEFFEGRWVQSGMSCTETQSDTRPITLTPSEIRYYESRCSLANPTPIRGMVGLLYDATCSGEGTEWTYRLLLLQEADGRLTLSHDGYTDTFQKCP